MGSAGGSDASTCYRARAAALVVDVQTKRLALEQRRGALISRDRALLKVFAFARMLRDRWLNWPARIGPQLAADLDVEPAHGVRLAVRVGMHTGLVVIGEGGDPGPGRVRRHPQRGRAGASAGRAGRRAHYRGRHIVSSRAGSSSRPSERHR